MLSRPLPVIEQREMTVDETDWLRRGGLRDLRNCGAGCVEGEIEYSVARGEGSLVAPLQAGSRARFLRH